VNSVGAGNLLHRLKAETHTRHIAIEQALDLMSAALTLPTYREILQRFYGFYQPAEECLHVIAAAGLGLDVEARWKAPLLAADLRALGIEVPERLPRCGALPALSTRAEAFGCLYVLEGATLGGRFIHQHVSQVLGLTVESGARFFFGYGQESGPMWRAFGAAVTDFATTEALQDIILRAAAETFDRLHHWCVQGDLDG
jgi:heme oxygenase